MNREVRLQLTGLADYDVQDMTRDLCRTLKLEAGIQGDLAQAAGAPGARGDVISVGGIVLSFISSGAALALVNVLKAYFERRPSLEIEVQRDTRKVRIRAENVDASQIDKTTDRIRELLTGEP